MKLTVCDDRDQWDEMVIEQGGHPLQLWGWGELKSAHRWQAHRLIATDSKGRVVGGAQVLQRQLPKPFRSLLYVPRGPVGDSETILPLLANYCMKSFKSVQITIEPHQTTPVKSDGWRKVTKSILVPETIILDLSKSQDELLSAMSKKTRQYIRKSANSGVVVRRGEEADLEACLDIYRQTAQRAKFGLHDDQYYLDLHAMLGEASQIFVAEIDGQIVSFIWFAVTPEVAFELYGGMNQLGQNKRANYCLKWQAITDLKAAGVRTYDVNGLLNDGVSNFKQGFASHKTSLAGSYDYPLSIWYPVWRTAFPLAKQALQTIASLRK